MIKRKTNPVVVPAWIRDWAERLKTDVRKAEQQIDWTRTPAYERAFIENLIASIETTALTWATQLNGLEAQSRDLFNRLHRLPTLTSEDQP